MMPANSRRRFAAFVVVLAMAALPTFAVRGAGPKFYRDDPLPREPEIANASKVAPRDIDLVPDLLAAHVHEAGRPVAECAREGYQHDRRGPGSSWFTTGSTRTT
jgi:hypothetical protein